MAPDRCAQRTAPLAVMALPLSDLFIHLQSGPTQLSKLRGSRRESEPSRLFAGESSWSALRGTLRSLCVCVCVSVCHSVCVCVYSSGSVLDLARLEASEDKAIQHHAMPMRPPNLGTELSDPLLCPLKRSKASLQSEVATLACNCVAYVQSLWSRKAICNTYLGCKGSLGISAMRFCVRSCWCWSFARSRTRCRQHKENSKRFHPPTASPLPNQPQNLVEIERLHCLAHWNKKFRTWGLFRMCFGCVWHGTTQPV